jgi:hypothetical protein
MMKKIMTAMVVVTAGLILQCCSTDDPLSYSENNATWSGNSNVTAEVNGSTTNAESGELVSFDVNIDQSTAEPTATVAAYYPDEEDNLTNNSFTTLVDIDMSNPTAKTENGVTVTVNGNHITANHGEVKSVCYVVSGQTSNGSLTILGEKKYAVKLTDVSIQNPDSAALNLLSKKRAFITLSGTNTLTDGTSSQNDHKGALYCKGKLIFASGSGQLTVNGNYNNAIHSADYIVFDKGNNIYAKSTANHGVKANDGIYINGGILNVEVSAAAAKGINSESDIQVNGGRTTVIATGGGAYEDGEAKGAAAVKCDSVFTQNGGELYLKATANGGKGLKADWEAYINGGKLRVVTTGGVYSSGNDTASPKGVKVGTKNVHGVLNIAGGDVMVRTNGQKGEGIESKGSLTVSGGSVVVSAYDDAINSSGDMYLTGGSIVAVGRNNDGIDANGNLYIEGGTVVAYGAGGAESGIDTSERTSLYIKGGNIIGIGGRIDATLGSTTQGIVSTSGTLNANATVTVSDGSKNLATFTLPPYSTSGTILLSTQGMTSGNSYYVNWGSQTSTVTATNSLSGSVMGGFPGGRH